MKNNVFELVDNNNELGELFDNIAFLSSQLDKIKSLKKTFGVFKWFVIISFLVVVIGVLISIIYIA